MFVVSLSVAVMIPMTTAVASKKEIAREAVQIVGSMALGASLTGLVILLHSCVTSDSKIDTAIVCGAFEPITWEDDDSKATRRQIVDHNAVWDFYCKGNKND